MLSESCVSDSRVFFTILLKALICSLIIFLAARRILPYF